MSTPRACATLDEWLSYFETLHPKKIDFSLDRMRAVLARLGIAHPSYRVLTVGGTNGKGSCVAILESIYLAAGYSVGAFSSPHLVRFNERIRFDGRDASDAALIDLFARMDAALGEITLTYFESSAVAAMLYFADREADLAILEVGMGGRLDSVNAYDADAALIVSIDLDHVDWLGPDREAIAAEKAGILRAGRPAVIADRDPPKSLLAAVDGMKVPARFYGVDYDCRAQGDRFELRQASRPPTMWPRPSFGSEIQVANAAACLMLVDAMRDALPVSDAALTEGLRKARVQGRCEKQSIDGVEWLFDVAHNAAAARLLARDLAESQAANRTLAVFGAMSDKALAEVVEPFVALVDAWFIGPLDSERSADCDTLKAIFKAAGAVRVIAAADIASASGAARETAMAGDRVVVFGSFYTVGPAMAALGLYSPSLE